MPKRAKELGAIDAKRLGEGVHAVGGVPGLCLQVKGSNAKSWILRVTTGAKRRKIGLGVYPEVSLANARLRAFEIKDEIRRGIDPIERRKEARAKIAEAQKRGLTFAAAVQLFLPVKSQELAVGKYRDQWRDSLDKYAMPEIGNRRVHDIQMADILRVLDLIWAEKYVTVDKLRRKLNEILDFCTVKGHRSGPNPARWEGNLSHVLGTLPGASKEEHFPALQFKDLPRFWGALSGREGMGAAALMFQTLTATRSGAVRFMTWSEVDFADMVWTVQPERQSSKIGKKDSAKRVPLTHKALTLLQSLPRLENNGLVFWAPRGGALSDATLGKVVRAIHQADLKAGNEGFLDAKTKEVVVPHGIRSTFKN